MNKVCQILLIYLFLSTHVFAMKRKEVSHTPIFPYLLILHIQKNDTDEVLEAQNCSKYALAKNSAYFAQEIKNNPEQFNLKKIIRDHGEIQMINIPDQERESYIKVLDWLHDNRSDTKINLDEIFILFRISKVEWQCNDNFLADIFSQKINIKEYSDEEIDFMFDPPQDIKLESLSYENIILSIFIQKKFNNIGQIADNLSLFKKLKISTVKLIFSNERFRSDTTNSIFSLMVSWLYTNDRLDDIFLFFPFFDLHNFSIHYLKSIVNNFLQECKKDWLDKPEAIHQLNEFYELALRASTKETLTDIDNERAKKIGCDLENPPRFAKFYPDAEKQFTMKVVYGNLSKWVRRTINSSNHLFSNGYFFRFYLSEEQKSPNDVPYLFGRLLCLTEITEEAAHYLPISLTIKIHQRQGVRQYGPISGTFKHYGKSLGLPLTLPDEDLEKMRLCLFPYDEPRANDIVVDDQITVIINVEFN